MYDFKTVRNILHNRRGEVGLCILSTAVAAANCIISELKNGRTAAMWRRMTDRTVGDDLYALGQLCVVMTAIPPPPAAAAVLLSICSTRPVLARPVESVECSCLSVRLIPLHLISVTDRRTSSDHLCSASFKSRRRTATTKLALIV